MSSLALAPPVPVDTPGSRGSIRTHGAQCPGSTGHTQPHSGRGCTLETRRWATHTFEHAVALGTSGDEHHGHRDSRLDCSYRLTKRGVERAAVLTRGGQADF